MMGGVVKSWARGAARAASFATKLCSHRDDPLQAHKALALTVLAVMLALHMGAPWLHRRPATPGDAP